MAIAPLANEVVTIMGNISGVNPTAIEIANNKADNQSPFVIPFKKKTIGTIINIYFIITQETALTPFSKLVITGS